jgi:hypothetical protein
MLRSTQGWIGQEIVFSRYMTMLGINCEWRMTWSRRGADEFGFANGTDGRRLLGVHRRMAFQRRR